MFAHVDAVLLATCLAIALVVPAVGGGQLLRDRSDHPARVMCSVATGLIGFVWLRVQRRWLRSYTAVRLIPGTPASASERR